MAEHESWPVVFVAWKSKADEIFAELMTGTVDAGSPPKMHARAGAPFVALVEDGRVLAIGEVVANKHRTYELSLKKCVPSLDDAPTIDDDLQPPLKAVPRGFLRGPFSALFVPTDSRKAVLPVDWFDTVFENAAASLGDPQDVPADNTSEAPAEPPADPPPTSEPLPAAPAPAEAPPSDERESVLRSWIPPALSGLLDDHVRADEWELVVAQALCALGFDVDRRGQQRPGQAEPDCIARYTSVNGVTTELIIDAKAGRWTAPVDNLRAMADYMSKANAYAHPVFVANSLSQDVPQKLLAHMMPNRQARAITGRDLAVLIMQRLREPRFDVQLELRRILGA